MIRITDGAILHRDIPGFDETGYYFQLTLGRTLMAEEHRHDFYEFAYLVSGSCIHTVNGIGHPAKAGSLFLLRPADIHAFSGQTPETKCRRAVGASGGNAAVSHRIRTGYPRLFGNGFSRRQSAVSCSSARGADAHPTACAGLFFRRKRHRPQLPSSACGTALSVFAGTAAAGRHRVSRLCPHPCGNEPSGKRGGGRSRVSAAVQFQPRPALPPDKEASRHDPRRLHKRNPSEIRLRAAPPFRPRLSDRWRARRLFQLFPFLFPSEKSVSHDPRADPPHRRRRGMGGYGITDRFDSNKQAVPSSRHCLSLYFSIIFTFAGTIPAVS